MSAEVVAVAEVVLEAAAMMALPRLTPPMMLKTSRRVAKATRVARELTPKLNRRLHELSRVGASSHIRL